MSIYCGDYNKLAKNDLLSYIYSSNKAGQC